MSLRADTSSSTSRFTGAVRWLALVWLVLAGATAGIARAGESEPIHARALLLYSNHPGFESAAAMEQEVRSVLARRGVQLDVAYMDDRRSYGPPGAASLHKQMGHKLSGKRPYGVILVSDDSALRFALRSHRQLFHGRPLVLLAVDGGRRVQSLDAVGEVVASFFQLDRHTALVAR